MDPIVNIAIKAARKASNVILRHLDRIDRIDIETKGRHDYVSEVDRMAEAEIIDIISNSYPDHAFLAEESGSSGQGDNVWIIDPLDGTTNFLHGYPQFAVSIALQHRGKLEHAVILDPLRDEIFSASRGQGARLNDRRIRVSGSNDLDKALLGTGFPFKVLEHLDVWLGTFRELLVQTSGIRRAGAATLDLAHVACGRLDGFWEFGLMPWDMAAGILLIQESGGIVSDISGGNDYLQSGNIIAANPDIYEAMFKSIKPRIEGVFD